jgi:hypothetical protein
LLKFKEDPIEFMMEIRAKIGEGNVLSATDATQYNVPSYRLPGRRKNAPELPDLPKEEEKTETIDCPIEHSINIRKMQNNKAGNV